MKAIEVISLSFSYNKGETWALKDVTYSQERGEFVVLMGECGAGKSTFCYTLNRLVPNFHKGLLRGHVKIMGQDIDGRKVYDMAQMVGLVFQDFEAQLFSTNVELELAFGPENFYVEPDEIKKRIKDVLFRLRLRDFEGRRVGELSGGEKQRLAIGSILTIRPDILVMDEPTTDLDPKGKEEIFDLLSGLRSRHTILLVEHETEMALCVDRLVIMHQGKVALEGAPKEIFSQPEILEAFGIRPLQTPKAMMVLGERPYLSIDEAKKVLGSGRFRIRQERYRRLKEAECKWVRGEDLIIVNSLSFRYKEKWVLKEIDLSIKKGDFIAIIGQNGSGKTTLVKHFNALLKPTLGQVVSFGMDTRGRNSSDFVGKIGFVFQNPNDQIFAHTVADEVRFGAKNMGLPKKEVERITWEVLDLIGISSLQLRDPLTLTRGERQLVAIASALATKPLALILDEPTTGLDYNQQKRIMDILKRINQQGRTIIFITHSMWVVCEYAKRVVVLSGGRVIMDGPPREVFSKETILSQANIVAPELVRLSNSLGHTLLTINEFAFCIERVTGGGNRCFSM